MKIKISKSLLLFALPVVLLTFVPISANHFKNLTIGSEAAEDGSRNLSWNFPKDEPTVRTQANFDDYSWQMFVALCWPAKSGTRGKPDKSKKIGDPGPVVWQTFRSAEETFLPNGKDPGPWDDVSRKSFPSFVLNRTSKVDPAMKGKLSRKAQAVGGPLYDQNGNYTYYNLRMNKKEYDFIRKEKYYSKDILGELTGDLILPFYSMEVKSAWRILPESRDHSRFFTRKAKVQSSGGSPKNVYVGLVGLHITYKTPQSKKWIWATFEHKDNAPVQVESNSQPVVVPGVKYSYYDPECSLAKCTPNQKAPKDPPPGYKTQVTRRTDIRKEAQAANKNWQNLLKGTVWENYMLITTQWEDEDGYVKPGTSANTVLETYIQVDNSSCYGCHSVAKVNGAQSRQVYSDFSFMFLEAK